MTVLFASLPSFKPSCKCTMKSFFLYSDISLFWWRFFSNWTPGSVKCCVHYTDTWMMFASSECYIFQNQLISKVVQSDCSSRNGRTDEEESELTAYEVRTLFKTVLYFLLEDSITRTSVRRLYKCILRTDYLIFSTQTPNLNQKCQLCVCW